MEQSGAQAPVAAETTWLENIIHLTHSNSPQGPILLITLANHHRYAIPLYGGMRDYVHRVVSPLVLVNNLPTNGSEAPQPNPFLPGQ